jgi:phospholipid transport system substrate-binding protein
VAVSVLVAAAWVSQAAAGEPTDRLRTLFDGANRVLLSDTDVALEERVTAIRALLNDAFDARDAAALALGREWQKRTAAQRDEFARLYTDLVERAYLAWVGSRARVHGDGVRVAFVSESTRGDTSSVETTLTTRGAGEMPIEYHMTRHEGRWRIRDVVVDGLSLADSYRAQFQRVLQSGGYAELVARLQEKVAPSPPLAPETPVTATPLPTTALAVTSPPMPAPRAAPIVSTPMVTPVPLPPPIMAPAAKPASAPAVVAPAPTWFWVQVGAFRDTDAASRLVERLHNHRVTVATGGQRREPLARVLVGPFVSRAAAGSALRELVAAGYRAFIAAE